MSGGGGGIIIIRNLIENPGTNAQDKSVLEQILKKCKDTGVCSRMDRWKVAMIVYGLLGRP